MNAKTETPVLSRKPVVRPLAHGAFDVTFPCGGVAKISAEKTEDNALAWYVQAKRGEHFTSVRCHGLTGLASTTEQALSAAWVACFRNESVPAWGSIEDVHALASKCENDRSAFVKAIKQIGRARFGLKLRARGNTGTARSWVTVEGSGETPTAPEYVALALVNGYDHLTYSASVRPCRGSRFSVICRLAGHPTPEGFTVAERSWD